MAFNLKKVLKALLLSTNQPLATKDIQAAFSRFHAAATGLPLGTPSDKDQASRAQSESAEARVEMTGVPAQPVEEPGEVIAEAPADPELYVEVPSLVTATQI